MAFNSFPYLLAFLPIVLAGFYALGRWRPELAKLWLLGASLVFYGWWSPAHLPLLLLGVAWNGFCGRAIAGSVAAPRRQAAVLALGIAVDLGLLFFFKYLFPLLRFLGDLGFGLAAPGADPVLPLGISFFAFTQIAYLVDCKAGMARPAEGRGQALDYAVFAIFFPSLVAGPILHNRELVPQLGEPATFRLRLENLVVGFTLFALGLAKKVLIADRIAASADAGFAAPASLPLFAAWGTALAYSLELYFDFSGYSDMAIGSARMLGLKLPLNFNSPYKAQSIIDFWQRWHMTLTRFLTLYLYNPVALAMARRRAAKGLAGPRQAASLGGFASLVLLPTFYTMILIGVWHGAGWQFLVFGLLHAAYLSLNHAWRLLAPRRSPGGRLGRRHAAVALNVALTYGAVLAAQIFFRAGSVGDALSLLAGMAGRHGMETAAGGAVARVEAAEIVLLLAIVWAMPNSQEMLARYAPALGRVAPARPRWLAWRPSLAWGLVIGGMLCLAAAVLQDSTRFLYFQF